MAVPVDCACGRTFQARDDQAGGLVNCPACGKAAEVPGLRDPLWRLLVALAAFAWAGATAAVAYHAGAAWAVVCAVVLGGFLWLLSRAL